MIKQKRSALTEIFSFLHFFSTSPVRRPTSFVTRLVSFTLLITTFLLLSSSFVQAEVSHLINYQGRLTGTADVPLNDSYAITFRIYDAEIAGNMLWEETQSSVVVQKGIFSVLLGSVTNLGLDFDIPYFLEIKVGIEVMSPRQRIISAGYAIKAEKADFALSAATAQSADLAVSAATAQSANVANALSDTSRLVPTGAIIMCKSSCPAGYARVEELDGKFLTGGASYNSNAGGSNTHAHNISNHSHTLDSIAVSGAMNDFATGLYIGAGRDGTLRQKGTIFPPSQNGAVLKTSTTLAGVGAVTSGDSRPSFATIIFCEKQ